MNQNKKIFRLANKAFVVVFFAYMLDVLYARLDALGMGLYGAPFFLIGKVFVYGGIFATGVEMLLDKDYLLDTKNFFDNCKKFFWAYIVFLVFIVFVDIGFSTNFNSFQGWDFVFAKNHFQILSYPIIVYSIIRAKKRKVNKDCSKRPSIKIRDFISICSLYFADLFLFYLSEFIVVEKIEIARVTLIVSKYIQMYLFLYLGYFVAFPYISTNKEKSKEKELYLINPTPRGFLGYMLALVYPNIPWLFFVLEALTPKEYGVKIFSNVELLDEDYLPGKLVAITSYSSNAHYAYSIAKKFKERGSKVIMGGPHMGFLPDEALCFCDSVVIGEAENVWGQIIEDYENDCLKPKYYGEYLDNFYEKVDEAIFHSKEKRRFIQFETTRGCKFSCDFCVIPGLTSRKIRHRPVENVIKIIETFREDDSVVLFLDNNIYADPKYSIELFKALEKVNIRWCGSSSIDIAKDDEVLDLLKRSGCHQLLIGYEISDVSKEKERKGKFSMAENYVSLSKKIMKKGIEIDAKFIVGFEKDNYKSFWDLWKFCFKLRPTITSIGMLTPLPGSRFYNQILEQDKLLTLNWSTYALNKIVFMHEGLNERIVSMMAFAIALFYFFSTSILGIRCLLLLVFAILLLF